MSLPLIIGTAQFGQKYGITNAHGAVGVERAKNIISKASANGLSFFDTAREYGESEDVLGEVLTSNCKVISKIKPFKAEDVFKSVHTSLAKLSRNYLDGLLIHNPDILVGEDADEIWVQMESLKAQKIVKKVGISVYNPDIAAHLSNKYDIDILQIPVNIFDQRLFDYKSNGVFKNVEIHARSLFLQGILLSHINDIPYAVRDHSEAITRYKNWCSDRGLTLLQACVAFAKNACDKNIVDFWVVGVAHEEELEQVASAWKNCDHYEPLWEEMLHFAHEDESLINPSKWRR